MNKIHNADAITILPTIPDNSIDLILTDPPYNTTSLELDKQSFNLEDYMQEFKRVLKPNGWLFCFGSLEIGVILLNHFRQVSVYLGKITRSSDTWNRKDAYTCTRKPMGIHSA